MSDRASAALSTSTAASDPLIGRVIGGRFRVNALIARGGMGKVYRAEQAPLGRVCAIKVLNPSYAGEHDPEFHKRFFLEASIASKLTHPNTVTIFDYGRTDDVYYMAMEYLEGQTLHRAIRDAGHLPEERVIHITKQVCRALREAHSLGVIHRDLKPANIFLLEHGDESDFVKVLDFGLVKLADNKGEDLTQTGMFMGSPKYMSPEQIRGDRVDARSDVYSLGIILFEMLTGKVPFDRPNSVNILMAHVSEEPPPMRQVNPDISLSTALEETVARCMAKDPDQRLRSMDELLASLKRAGGERPSAPITGLEATERGSLSGSASGARPGIGAAAGASGSLPSAQYWDPPAPAARRISRESGAPAPSARLWSAEPPGKTGSRAMLLAAVLAALGVAGTIGYAVIRPTKTAGVDSSVFRQAGGIPPAAPATAAVAAAMPAVAAAASPSAPSAVVKLRVITDPEGASVREDGSELCSSTPCDVVYKGSDAEPAREHKWTLARQGYRVETRSVLASDSPVSVKLSPLARAASPAPAKVEAPAAVPSGYKADIPY